MISKELRLKTIEQTDNLFIQRGLRNYMVLLQSLQKRPLLPSGPYSRVRDLLYAKFILLLLKNEARISAAARINALQLKWRGYMAQGINCLAAFGWTVIIVYNSFYVK